MPFLSDIPPSAPPENPPAIAVANEYTPKHANLRGYELSSMDYDGVKFAAIGVRSGLRAVGFEAGYKFRETQGGFRTGVTLTSFYNWVKDEGETEAKYVMAKQKSLGPNNGRLLYDVTFAYNLSSGAYASSTIRREFKGGYKYGIFENVTPYVSATISTDRAHREMRMGATSAVDFVGNTHLKLDVAAEFSHGKPKIVVSTSFRFK